MEVKSFEVSLIVFVVIGVFLAACSCAPPAGSSEKPTSNPDLVSGIFFLFSSVAKVKG